MSENQKIEIEVINTANDYRRVLLMQSYKKFAIAGILYLIVVIPMLWLTFFGAGANPLDGKNKSVIYVMILFAVLPILIASGIYLNIWRQSKAIEKTLEPVNFIFSTDELEIKSKSSSAKTTWDSLQKIQELKEDFLFFPQNNIFYTVPKRSFQSDFQIEDFRNLVREKLGKKAKLKS